jgi:hypothetical protein
MACPELEDLLIGRAGDHALHCKNCRALLESSAEVDSIFETAFAGISAPAEISSAVRVHISVNGRLQRVSPIPEILDLIGWAAVLAMAAIILPRFPALLSSILPRLG